MKSFSKIVKTISIILKSISVLLKSISNINMDIVERPPMNLTTTGDI
jgi:hypothetical protein